MTTFRAYSRRSFLKSLAVTAAAGPFVARGWAAQSPGEKVRHAAFGAGGMAWADLNELAKFAQFELVAVAEVDLNRAQDARKAFPRARIYQDWRELLDKEHKNIDSVNVSTPDHMHAPMVWSALQLGKHVYGQKPLAHDLYEVRKLTELARRTKVVTQMGIQIHSTSFYKSARVILQSGAIGRIKEVHSWCPKSWGDPEPLPDRHDTPPENFDWDKWLGVCAERPFIANGYYHPSTWRKRLDFGTGTFGDMGCHLFDPVFDSLALGAPLSVRSEGPAPNQWNWAVNSLIRYTFAGTPFTADKTLPVTWYDGAQKPPQEVLALLEGDEPPRTGSIFVGTHGTMVLPHWSRPLLYPDKTFKDYKFPESETVDHWGEFLSACRGRTSASAPFDFGGPLTEAVLLGGVASRFPQTTLKWDSKKLAFDLSEANAFVRRAYRKGWEIKGLA